MPSFADIGVSQPAASTITMRVATITLTRNSTVTHQEILTVGDPDSTNGLAAVLSSSPASSAWGLVTRVADAVTVRSSAANALITAYQSSAADLQVTAEPGAGTFKVQPGSSVATVAFPVRIVDSSGTGFAPLGIDYTDGSTTSTLAAAGVVFNNSSNNTMRMVGSTSPLPVTMLPKSGASYASTTILVLNQTGGGSTTLVSSVAASAHKVYAFSVTSTHTTPSSCAFISSAATEEWGLQVGSGSSGVTGANLAVSPPAFLFKTVASEALGFTAVSTGLYRISISYFTE